jgi:hypothetical protein
VSGVDVSERSDEPRGTLWLYFSERNLWNDCPEARPALERLSRERLRNKRAATPRGAVDLRPAGDLLQSSASRMAEWVKAQSDVPYEVHMAACEAAGAVEDWTTARRGTV